MSCCERESHNNYFVPIDDYVITAAIKSVVEYNGELVVCCYKGETAQERKERMKKIILRAYGSMAEYERHCEEAIKRKVNK